MSSRPSLALLFALAAAGGARAEVPSVAADIAPVHALVARVMDGVGTPALIVPPGASPHGHALRPSEASALQAADLVFWIGPALTPPLGDAIETLVRDAISISLLDLPGTTILAPREGALFVGHEHDDGGGDADEDHGEGERDPHAWLDPTNAGNWLGAIAAALSRADPEHAATYAANAAAGRLELGTLRREIDAILAPVRGRRFVTFHDAYQYFETAFDIPAAGAIAVSDATPPGPARIAEIRDRMAGSDIVCVLAEPQFSAGLVAAILDGTGATAGTMDPLGADIAPGPSFYPELLRRLAGRLVECLS